MGADINRLHGDSISSMSMHGRVQLSWSSTEWDEQQCWYSGRDDSDLVPVSPMLTGQLGVGVVNTYLIRGR